MMQQRRVSHVSIDAASSSSYSSATTIKKPPISSGTTNAPSLLSVGGSAAAHSSTSPAKTSAPKQHLEQQLRVSDVASVLSLMAQRHAMEQDRHRLVALSDTATKLMTQRTMMPKALANIRSANRIEVLLEELEAKRLAVKKLRHLRDVAQQEHSRLLGVNDSLLAMAKRKDDAHAQLLQQYHIAGSIDADAQDALLSLEGRRRKLMGFAKAFQMEIESVVDSASTPAKGNGARGSSSALAAANGKGGGGGPRSLSGSKEGTATEYRRSPPPSAPSWALNIDGGRDVAASQQRPPRLLPPMATAKSSPAADSSTAPTKHGTLSGGVHRSSGNVSQRQRQRQSGGASDNQSSDHERVMFDLRMSGHALLRSLEAKISQAVASGVTDVDSCVATAQCLKSVMTDSSEARGSLWLFAPCTKPACEAARARLAQLEAVAVEEEIGPLAIAEEKR